MKFTLQIKLGNAAMQTSDDIADALRQVAGRHNLATPGEFGAIRDLNGNTVGEWKVTKK